MLLSLSQVFSSLKLVIKKFEMPSFIFVLLPVPPIPLECISFPKPSPQECFSLSDLMILLRCILYGTTWINLTHDDSSSTSQEIRSRSSHDPLSIDNVDLPIVIKGMRSCTMHPISKYVSFNKLINNMKQFLLALSTSCIHIHHKQDLLDSKWKNAMIKKINALRSQGTLELVNLSSYADITWHC